MPRPALMRCASPGRITPWLPSLSRCSSAPSSTHVTISMSRCGCEPEAGAGRDHVVVVHEQQPVVRVLRVVVLREAEAVPRVEPVELLWKRSSARRTSTVAMVPPHQPREPGLPLNGPDHREVIHPP